MHVVLFPLFQCLDLDNLRAVISRFCHSSTLRLAIVPLVVLSGSSVAFSGEIQDAAQSGDVEMVKAMLNSSPDLVFNKDSHGRTALAAAADAGSKDMTELLLAHKADVNAQNDEGDTPLHLVADKGWNEMAELLLTNKADVNARNKEGWTPLDKAVFYGNQGVAKILLAHKADVNAKTQDGWTPLYLVKHKGEAGSGKKQALMDLLSQHGGHE